MPEHQEPVSRRDFARMAAVAAAVPLTAAAGQTALQAAEGEKKEASKASHERPLHELYLDVLRNRFPHEKLSGETVELVRADIAGDLGRYRAVNDYPLKNSDEPGFVFAAWRGE